MLVVKTTSAGVTRNGALVAPRYHVPSSRRTYAGCGRSVTRSAGRRCRRRRLGVARWWRGVLAALPRRRRGVERQRLQRRGRLLLLPELVLQDRARPAAPR